MHYTISKDIKGQCHEIFDTLFAKNETFCLLKKLENLSL